MELETILDKACLPWKGFIFRLDGGIMVSPEQDFPATKRNFNHGLAYDGVSGGPGVFFISGILHQDHLVIGFV